MSIELSALDRAILARAQREEFERRLAETLDAYFRSARGGQTVSKQKATMLPGGIFRRQAD